MDFGALPPEVNSARLYAGAGSTSLTTAASAWNALAAELQSAALGYENVVTQLSSEEWLGPASASMAAAVQPYVDWMSTTATQAEQAASQASAAAAAFEQAFASVVPPPLIAANRATLAQAVATNVLGQNTGVIAQLEAQYGEMWAQDAAAMYTYAGQSASATKVTPYTAAPQVADPSASAKQSSATATAAGTSAGTAQNTLQQAVTSTPSQLQSLANPTANATTATDPFSEIWFLLTGQTASPTNLGAIINGYAPFAGFFYNTEGLPYFSVGMGNSFVQIAKSAGILGGAAPAAAKAATGAAQGLGGLGAALGGGGSQVAAGLGHGAHVAGLSVPQSWPGATAPSIAKPISAVPVSEVITAPDSGAGNLVGGVPASGVGGPVRGAGAGPRYGFKPTVMARPLSAG
ncbi:PPE family protein [Mycobacterium heidelbergense]|uniref:PPE family protein n=1 Tax=Mycobacterium heidelbergense TaxID=53376 RepID=UPI003CECAAEA